MKLRVATIAATALLLTGCSSSDALPEADYYNLVRDTDGLGDMQDETIAEVGGNICKAFEADPDSYAPVLAAMLDTGMDSGQAGALIGLSLSQYCPDEIEHIPGQ
jgi:PBP1b-binding outer membrane lipoprotein LpoB